MFAHWCQWCGGRGCLVCDGARKVIATQAAREAEGVPEDEAPTNHPGLQDMEDADQAPPDESAGQPAMGPAPAAPENEEG